MFFLIVNGEKEVNKKKVFGVFKSLLFVGG